MKDKLLLILCIALFLTCMSCNKDSSIMTGGQMLGMQNTFSFELEASTFPSFISISDQSGNVVFDTVGVGLNNSYVIDVENNDPLDFTYGYESPLNNFFSIRTYRRVESGFSLTSFGGPCQPEFFPYSFFDRQNVKIEISGISSFTNLIAPLGNKSVTEETQSNKLIIEGLLSTGIDMQVTVLDENNVPHSYIIKEEDWTTQNGNIKEVSISFDDFLEPTIHEIDLKVDDNWMVIADIMTTDQRVLSISSWSKYVDYQNGTIINLYTLPGTEVELLKLKLKSGNFLRGHNWSRIINQIPEEINFYEPSISLNNIQIDSYSFSSDLNYDLSRIEYSYESDSYLSLWNIYDLETQRINHALPELQFNFGDDFPMLDSLINSPRDFVIELIDVDDEAMLAQEYSTSSIDKQLSCYDLRSRYIDQRF